MQNIYPTRKYKNAAFRKIIFILLLILGIHQKQAIAQEKLYREQFRPQFHFSPKTNWTNDPNG